MCRWGTYLAEPIEDEGVDWHGLPLGHALIAVHAQAAMLPPIELGVPLAT